MVDRLIHHAEIVSLKGNSYRLKNRRKVASAG
jgi:DNA replication protein DnaC